jgi:hypothetical protein
MARIGERRVTDDIGAPRKIRRCIWPLRSGASVEEGSWQRMRLSHKFPFWEMRGAHRRHIGFRKHIINTKLTNCSHDKKDTIRKDIGSIILRELIVDGGMSPGSPQSLFLKDQHFLTYEIFIIPSMLMSWACRQWYTFAALMTCPAVR